MAMAALGMIAAAVVADGAKPVALVDVLQAACQNETNAKTEYLGLRPRPMRKATRRRVRCLAPPPSRRASAVTQAEADKNEKVAI